MLTLVSNFKLRNSLNFTSNLEISGHTLPRQTFAIAVVAGGFLATSIGTHWHKLTAWVGAPVSMTHSIVCVDLSGGIGGSGRAKCPN